MPAISFSALEILPSLLNKTKTQTIRPLWSTTTKLSKMLRSAMKNLHGKEEGIERLYPRFKAGDKVQLMWKQRSKAKWFCKECGSGLDVQKVSSQTIENVFYSGCKCNRILYKSEDEQSEVFPKRLGIAEITKVFEIEMWTGNDAPLITGYTLKQTEELARLDGFPEKSIKTPDIKYADFWHFFFKYDLSTPKKFAVYRFKWR